MRVQVLWLARNEGSVLLFDALTEEGEPITVAVDHRPAGQLLMALAVREDVLADIEEWMIVS